MNWFQGKVIFEKTAEDGNIVKVSQSYLVDALSFSEAESKLIEELKPFISGEFAVSKIKRSRFTEIFFDETGDKYYKAQIRFTTLDEEKGIEKFTIQTVIAQANSIQGAIQGIEEGMKGTMSDWDIKAVSETDILDVFKYVEPTKDEENAEETQVTE